MFWSIPFLTIVLVYSLFAINFASWVSDISDWFLWILWFFFIIDRYRDLKCDNIFVNRTKKVVKIQNLFDDFFFLQFGLWQLNVFGGIAIFFFFFWMWACCVWFWIFLRLVCVSFWICWASYSVCFLFLFCFVSFDLIKIVILI